MSTSLLENLIGFYEEDPDDPFNAYALALEYMKSDATQAAAFFDLVLDKHPGYLPVYYSAAGFYKDLEKWERSAAIYERGVSLAREQGNVKTTQELLRAQRALLDEMED